MKPVNFADVTLKELIHIAREKGIHRALLTQHATVEPVRVQRGIVLTPMVRVVATLFDRTAKTIYRWQEIGKSKQMVVAARTVRSPGSDVGLIWKMDEIRTILREEGLEVDEGEWTPETVHSFITARNRALNPARA